MCKASQILTESLGSGAFKHPDDDSLNRHVLSAGARWIGVGWRLDKVKGKSLPIDAAIALAMALRVLVEAGELTTTDPPRAAAPSAQVMFAR